MQLKFTVRGQQIFRVDKIPLASNSRLYIAGAVDFDSEWDNGEVKKAAADLWDTADNSPDNAADLWETIDYKDGYRIIPSVITVTTAFAKGERGWWNGKLYESKVGSNVYTPEQYADNWMEV